MPTTALHRPHESDRSQAKTRTYQAHPCQRPYIPKADGEHRALGIATLEDKVVQRTVAQVPSAIYEEDFLGWSYGFRPGRGQHDALAVGLQTKKVNWVLDAEIRWFYDTLDQRWLRKFLEHRIADPRVLRLIQKWMKAGVMEAGNHSVSEEGSVQGASASPLLTKVTSVPAKLAAQSMTVFVR